MQAKFNCHRPNLCENSWAYAICEVNLPAAVCDCVRFH